MKEIETKMMKISNKNHRIVIPMLIDSISMMNMDNFFQNVGIEIDKISLSEWMLDAYKRKEICLFFIKMMGNNDIDHLKYSIRDISKSFSGSIFMQGSLILLFDMAIQGIITPDLSNEEILNLLIRVIFIGGAFNRLTKF